jgi:hypothetical protein
MAAEPHPAPRTGRRTAGILLAVLNLGGALIVGFFGLLADGLRCDDSCSIAPGWRNDPTSWQWRGILVLALVILGASLVLNVAGLFRRARPLQIVAVAVQLVAAVFLAVISLTADETHGGWNYLVMMLLFFGATGIGSARVAPD